MNDSKNKITLVIHGGAGTLLKKNITAEKEKAYKDTLAEALQKGYNSLITGGTSLDAVVEAIKILEDSPLFNAGKGSVFTHQETNEMDAAIMDGKSLMAGSVAGVSTIKNPITAARIVMEKSNHVMLIGKGAEEFSESNGIEIVETSYFFTQQRYDQLKEIQNTDKMELDHTDNKFGTVGAVALDQYGNLAAGTSTGGLTNKKFGRVGDSPIIGAGTYANNETCAVSATGKGEYFIRSVAAHDISALIEYKNLSVEQATTEVIMNKLVKLGGEGGVIALDRKGNISMKFNSEGMYRGYIKSDGKTHIFIYKDE